jgi:hypothetical protein
MSLIIPFDIIQCSTTRDFISSELFDPDQIARIASAIARHQPDLATRPSYLRLASATGLANAPDILDDIFDSPKPVHRLMGIPTARSYARAIASLLTPDVPEDSIIEAVNATFGFPPALNLSLQSSRISASIDSFHAVIHLAIFSCFAVAYAPPTTDTFSIGDTVVSRTRMPMITIVSTPAPSAPASTEQIDAFNSKISSLESTLLALTSTVERLASTLSPHAATNQPPPAASPPQSYAAAAASTQPHPFLSSAPSAPPEPLDAPGNTYLYPNPTTHTHHEEVSVASDSSSLASSGPSDSLSSNESADSPVKNDLVKPSIPLFQLPSPSRSVLSSHVLAGAIKSANGMAFPLPTGHFVIVKEAPASKYSNEALSLKLVGDLDPSDHPRILYPTSFPELRAHADSMILTLMKIPKEPWLMDMVVQYQAFIYKLIQYWTNSASTDTHKTQFAILIQCYISILGNVILNKNTSIFLKLDDLWASYYSFSFRKLPTIPEFVDSFAVCGDKCGSCKCFGFHKLCCATTSCLNAIVGPRAPPTNTELYKAFIAWKSSPDSAPHRSRSDLFGWYKSSSFADRSLVAAHNAASKPSPAHSSYADCLKSTYLKQKDIKSRQIMVESMF